MIRLYDNFITNFRNNEGWSKEIKCNIGVRQGLTLSHTLFFIYISKLEGCLEGGFLNTTLSKIVINLLIYVDDSVILVRCFLDVKKQLIIIKDLRFSMGIPVNTHKTKVMITKSENITYTIFFYDNNNLEEVTSSKYLGLDFITRLTRTLELSKGYWRV